MFDDIVINGGRKLPRKPSLDRYDHMRPVNSVGDSAVISSQFFNWNGKFDKNSPSTRRRDKAELVAFGVNGEVPLAQARVNAGLDGPEARVRLWQQGLRPAGERGSGTTGKLLLSLEYGDAFVVGNGNVARYALDLLRYLRGPEFARTVRIVVASTGHEQLLGRRGRVIFDHDLFDAVPSAVYYRLLDVAGAINARWHPANDNTKSAALAA